MEVPKGLLIKSVRQVPTITICTDASYDPELKIGAWACYIRSDTKLIKLGKVIKENVSNSTEAERVGVANALWLAAQAHDISQHDSSSIVTTLQPSTQSDPRLRRGRRSKRPSSNLNFIRGISNLTYKEL